MTKDELKAVITPAIAEKLFDMLRPAHTLTHVGKGLLTDQHYEAASGVYAQATAELDQFAFFLENLAKPAAPLVAPPPTPAVQ